MWREGNANDYSPCRWHFFRSVIDFFSFQIAQIQNTVRHLGRVHFGNRDDSAFRVSSEFSATLKKRALSFFEFFAFFCG